MDMDDALGAIDDYCEFLSDTGIAEDRKKLHAELKALNKIVWADDFSEEDLLNLISKIQASYQSISDKQPYADIMEAVLFFQEFWKPKDRHTHELLKKLEEFGN
jgi:hypothetical protein